MIYLRERIENKTNRKSIQLIGNKKGNSSGSEIIMNEIRSSTSGLIMK